jgi:hypothetical protein
MVNPPQISSVIMRTAAFLLRVHDLFCEQARPCADFSCVQVLYVQEDGL